MSKQEKLEGPRYYDASKNPEGARFHVVPLRDITAEEFAALPEHVQRGVDASGFYFKSKPRGRSDEDAAAAAVPAEQEG